MNNSNDDFITEYLRYIGDSEAPIMYHRWCAISAVGALLGRRFYLSHGHFSINPNLYIMIIGVAAARKSTAIKQMKKLMAASGYDKLAANKTTKEKFLIDLSGEDSTDEKSILDRNLWGDDETELATREPAECYITADEWNEFTSLGNVEFYSLLGDLWDFEGIYTNRIKNGKSVSIVNPTISILGGNTPTGISLSFPAEIIGQGFFSRLLFIHADPTNKKITFPVKPEEAYTQYMVQRMMEIRAKCVGEVTLSGTAQKLLDKIYKTYQGFDDIRFESYQNRRFSQLLKLSLVCAASRVSTTIDECDVLRANTYLTRAEHSMPSALGEFGKGKNSDVTNKVVDALSKTNIPLDFAAIWGIVQQDLGKQSELNDILSNLRTAGKIFAEGRGFLAKKKPVQDVVTDTVDFSLLTNEERGK